MKKIRRTNQFKRRYKERILNDEGLMQDFMESVQIFREDRVLVADHTLEDVMQGKRAFSINDDYRVVYIEKDDEFVFLDIGTHEQVYKRS